MIEKDPTSYGLMTYVWVVGVALLGGLLSFLRKLNAGDKPAATVSGFLLELLAAVLAGVATFWLLESMRVDPLLTAAMVAISGNMGGRSLTLLERAWKQRIGV